MKAQLGAVLTLAGTNIKTTYTASTTLQLARAARVRFWVENVRSAGSPATTTTVKLQARYNDGTVQTTYVDLPSTLDDVQGAAQPKGSTFELEHAFATPANATTPGTFYLDKPQAISEITVSVKVNVQGQAGDTTTVYASVSPA